MSRNDLWQSNELLLLANKTIDTILVSQSVSPKKFSSQKQTNYMVNHIRTTEGRTETARFYCIFAPSQVCLKTHCVCHLIFGQFSVTQFALCVFSLKLCAIVRASMWPSVSMQMRSRISFCFFGFYDRFYCVSYQEKNHDAKMAIAQKGKGKSWRRKDKD